MSLVFVATSAISLILSSQSPSLQYSPNLLAEFQRQANISLPEPRPRGIPRRRQPAGTRGPCDDAAHAMTPLLPVADTTSDITSDDFSGMTQKSHPAFWFYIPDEGDSSIQGRFSLEDLDGNLIYRSDFDFPSTPALAGINVPETAPALQAGQAYRWHFKIHCTEEGSLQENFLFHTGLITHVENPSLSQQLATASPSERLDLYGEYDLWYDAVADSNADTLDILLPMIGLEYLQDVTVIEPIVVDP